MASIKKLNMVRESDVSRKGNQLAYNQEWYYEVDQFISSVEAETIIDSLGEGNAYGFIPVSSAHPDNSALIAIDYKVKRQGSQNIKYTINVVFSNDRTTINSSSSPLEAPANVNYDQIDREILVTKDPVTNKALTNTANRQIWPPLTENKPDSRITYVKNRRRFDNKNAGLYRNTVNEAPVYIDGKQYDTGTVKLERWTGSKQFDTNGREYFINTYSLLIREEGWKRTQISLGFEDIDGNVPNLEGRLLTEPWKLDENGKFYSKSEQEDPDIFHEFEVNTLEQKNYNFISFR